MNLHVWILLSFSLYSNLVDSILNPEEFPNLLAGTFTDGNRFSTGNTLPLVGRPWGFNHWSPQTKEAGRFSGSWWFSGNDHTLTWIRCTHQPSPWIGDWGYFFLTPQMGNIERSPVHEWQSRGALLKPYVMDITLAPKNIRFELTPTDHAAVVRVTFPQQSAQLGAKYVCFANVQWSDYGKDNSLGGSYISGKTSNVNSDRMLVTNFALYMKASSLEANEVISHEDLLCFHYPAQVTTAIIRIGTSLISPGQVNTNLQREVPSDISYDEKLLETKTVWNKLLRRVNVINPGDVTEQSTRYLQVFYTGLYRALMFPRRIDEIDSQGQVVHYSPYDPHGGIHHGPLVTDNGLWDTYRTVYPLLSLAYPDYLGTIIQGWLNAFKEGGWLPSWASPGYRNCMVGTFADVVIADAIVKEIKGFDIQLAIDALRKDAFEEPPRYVGGAVGKEGLQEYINQGYISFERGGEVVSRTLDYGFADFAAAQAFLALSEKYSHADISKDGLIDDARKLFQRSVRAFTSLWNRDKQLMVPKIQGGQQMTHMSPLEWGNGFTEGNSWHHSFPPYAFECVDTISEYQKLLSSSDLAQGFDCANGLISFFKGNEDGAYLKLKGLLESTSDFGFGSYGQEIHEMTEGRALAMGQYFHNNQPVHHILFLFSLLGKNRYRDTQRLVRTVLNRAYGSDFYSGDEDNGEQGAWFVLSALGLFSVTPGSANYVASSPIFPHVRISRSNEKEVNQGDKGIPAYGYLDLFAFLPPKTEQDSSAKAQSKESKPYYVQKVQVVSDDGDSNMIENHKVHYKYVSKPGVIRFLLESEVNNPQDISNSHQLMMKMHKTETRELEHPIHKVELIDEISNAKSVPRKDINEAEQIKYLKAELTQVTMQLHHLQHNNTGQERPNLVHFIPFLVVLLILAIAVFLYRNKVDSNFKKTRIDSDIPPEQSYISSSNNSKKLNKRQSYNV